MNCRTSSSTTKLFTSEEKAPTTTTTLRLKQTEGRREWIIICLPSDILFSASLESPVTVTSEH